MPKNICVRCNEAITNPLCMDCLSTSVVIWIGEKDPSLIAHAEEIKEIYTGYPDEGTSCIGCHKEMCVCPHCYTREVYDWLRTVSGSLTAEFVERFDFELKDSVA